MKDYRKIMRRIAGLYGELPQKAVYESEILLNAMAFDHGIAYERAASPDFNARLNEDGEACLQNLKLLVSARERPRAMTA